MKEIKSITFIGSGNVATQLANAFYEKGIRIDAIVSRTLKNAEKIAKDVNSKGFDALSNLPIDSDLYIISLKDDIVTTYLKDLRLSGKQVVHTSGSFETAHLASISNLIGSFYPLQTFNKTVAVDFKTIPIIIESENIELINSLTDLAKKLSENVYTLTAEQKKALHISAIGINNFTYFILSKSKEYCINNNVEFKLLKPLLKETIESFSIERELFEKQTGPAKRGDVSIIKNHIEALSNDKGFQSLYKDLSQYILSEFHGEKFKL